MGNFKKLWLLAAAVVVNVAAPMAQAGRCAGPGIETDVVYTLGTDTYVECFRGGEQARVIVDGDGDSDLDLYVYDENGNLIAYDNDLTDYCVVRFTPRWTGKFRIVIRNLGVANMYTITTN